MQRPHDPPVGQDSIHAWQEITIAPFDIDLELAVIDGTGTHALVFACRRIVGGWMNAETRQRLPSLEPTHWREWRD
jgi:hypothetical protein